MTGDVKKEAIVVTAADGAYFDLLKGLVLSIRDLEARQGASARATIGVVDLGLDQAQREELKDQCEVLTNPGLSFEIDRDDHSETYLLSRAVKSHINDCFPGYEVYVWLDSDTWVQSLAAIQLLSQAARAAGTAVVPELDRSYACLYDKASYLFRSNYDKVRDAFGKEAADKLLWTPVMNSGVVALRHDSPMWEAWRRYTRKAYESASKIISDQAPLNLAIYADGIPFHPLPSWCNWMCCHALPRFHAATLTFTEPALPFQELGILHLTRFAQDKKVPAADDPNRSVALDYLSVRALRAELGAPPPTGG